MVQGAKHPLLSCHHVQADIRKCVAYKSKPHPGVAVSYLINTDIQVYAAYKCNEPTRHYLYRVQLLHL